MRPFFLVVGIAFWVIGWFLAGGMAAIERDYRTAWFFFWFGCIGVLLTGIGASL